MRTGRDGGRRGGEDGKRGRVKKEPRESTWAGLYRKERVGEEKPMSCTSLG